MELGKRAAELKATRKMPYADCFVAALAKLRTSELVTGDMEFKQVEGDVKIL
jgi:predicted nucleic acid-binding protein